MACAAQIYKGAGLGYGEYSPIEIMQMLGSILPCLLRQLRQREWPQCCLPGRAGRPQFDNEGRMTIFL